MSEIQANITVESQTIEVTLNQNQIQVQPEGIQMQIYTGGYATAGGNNYTVQYNNLGILGGNDSFTFDTTNAIVEIGNLQINDVANLGSNANVQISGGSNGYALLTDGSGNLRWESIANANYANFAGEVVNTAQPNITSLGTLTALNVNGTSNLSDVSNVVILGGTNGYVLQTDGTGNLSWTAQTGGNAGNGVPGGSNTQIQYNDSGSFGGSAGFTFDKASNVTNLPGNLIVASIANVVGNLIAANANLGNLATANYFNGTLNTAAQPNITSLGTLTSLTVNGTANLGNVSNVKISGGSNGQFIKTDGNGNLSFGQSVTSWSNVSNIAVNDILFGVLLNGNAAPGANVTTFSNINFNNWSNSNINSQVSNGIGISLSYIDGNIWSKTTTGNRLAYSADTITWNVANTPFLPSDAPVKGSANLLIYQDGSNKAALSTTGTSWSNIFLSSSQTWGKAAFGNGTFIITAPSPSTVFVRSTTDGNTWANSNVTARAYRGIAYGNGVFIVPVNSQAFFIKSTDNGATWSQSNVGNTLQLWNDIAYGNGKFVAVAQLLGGGNSVSAVSTDDGGNWTVTNLSNVDNYTSVIYADGYFITADNTNGNVKYSTDGTTWSTVSSNTGTNGGILGYNEGADVLLNVDEAGSNIFASTATTTIRICNAKGNITSWEKAPAGTYKNLGGAVGNTGALFIRVA